MAQMISPLNSNGLVESQLDGLLQSVADAFGGDAMGWNGPLAYGVDTAARRVIEERRKKDPSNSLTILLTTTGGVVEVVQRIVATIRHHYTGLVNFVIPDYALSAGTVMALSGDAIFMDYYSRLGLIDPQVVRGDRLVPALGYCERYNDLIKKSAKTPLTDAELSVLIGAFDQAELHEFEQARELSIELLRDWLVRYKFKNWNETETNKKRVTPPMKRARANKIARNLSEYEAVAQSCSWHIS